MSRRVSAISFLSNIRGQGPETLPGYKCLQGTEVLESYRRSRARRRGGRQLPQAARKRGTGSGGRERTPEQKQWEKGSQDSTRKISVGSSERLERSAGKRRREYQSQWSEDMLVDSHPALPRRIRTNSSTLSTESLNPPVFVDGHSHQGRTRQLSGTLSDNSHCSSSIKEVTFIKEEDQSKITDERLVFLSHNKVPFYVTSCIPFHKSTKSRRHSQSRLSVREAGQTGHRQHRHTSGSRPHPLPAINDSFDAFELLGLERNEGQEVSYCQLLEPSYSGRECDRPVQPPLEQDTMDGRASPKSGRGSPHFIPNLQGDELQTWGQPLGTPYSPHTLDGWLGAGKHRTFLPFPSYITSIIEYVKPSDLKKELNEKFSERFPHVQLTLSKLRSIKLEMRQIGHGCDMDNGTIGQAYVYFEKLVLSKVINKDNRKFCAGASLILAAKLNDVKGDQLKNLIEKTETVFRLNRRDLLASEFAILVALQFSLHVPSQEVYPHYQRLLYQT